MEDILVQSSAFSDKAAVTTGKFVLYSSTGFSVARAMVNIPINYFEILKNFHYGLCVRMGQTGQTNGTIP